MKVKKIISICLIILSFIFMYSIQSTSAEEQAESGQCVKGRWTDIDGNTKGIWIWCVSSNFHDCSPVTSEPGLFNQ